MATTPNFNWATPDNTGLVKNGALDIRTLGDAIDASLVDLKGGTTNQVLAKNSNTDMDFKWVADAAGMTNPMTTTGDTIYSSSGSTPARLGIGSTGQVLTVAGGVPSWATPAGGGGMTLLSTTAITAANAINVTSISGSYTNLVIYVENFKMNTNQTNVFFRFNNNSGSIYDSAASNSVNSAFLYQTGATSMFVGGYANLGNSGNNTLVIQVPFYATTASYKTIDFNLMSNYGTSGYLNAGGWVGMGSTSAISEFNLFAGGGTNFAAQGNIKIYGVN
jgi:hypothetical protein